MADGGTKVLFVAVWAKIALRVLDDFLVALLDGFPLSYSVFEEEIVQKLLAGDSGLVSAFG